MANQIVAKRYGRNFVITIENKKYTKVIKEPGEDKPIIELIEEYNKRNTKKALDELIKLIAPKKEELLSKKKELQNNKKKIEKKIKTIKEKKSEVENEINTKDHLKALASKENLSDDEIKELESILQKYRKIESVVKPTPIKHSEKRTGEW